LWIAQRGYFGFMTMKVGPMKKGDHQRPLMYVASRASVPERGAMWRRLREEGMPITSSWIDEDGPGQTADMSELWARIEFEIQSSDGLILYAEPDDFPLKGALVEVGMALATEIPIVVVAPGVHIEPRTYRPFGSWANHARVTFANSVVEAERVIARSIGPL
jgi:hypothetical protein